jgi:predicted RNase H-like nuclease
MTLIGIDGCRGGWVVARATDELATIQFDVVDDVARVLPQDAIIAIDIPIGLPDHGSRRCDIEARQRLGPRQGSRVFPAPSRAALDGVGYSECCALNQRATGKRISRRTHGIIPKSREVDHAISPALQVKVREAHPEVTFRLLKGSPLLHSKKTTAGQAERLEILVREGLGFQPSHRAPTPGPSASAD